MDRNRVRDEVIEILANKLHKLPPPPIDASDDEEPFDYEGQALVPDITDNHLDIAEVAMDLEDAFGFNFDEQLPGGEGLETIGKVIDLIHSRVSATRPGDSAAAE
jgi:acyl carrier protein